MTESIDQDELSIDSSDFTAIGVLRVRVAWYHVDSNDAVLGLRGLKDEGRGAISVFVGSIAYSNCSTIMKGLGYGKVATSKTKMLYGPAATCWESVYDLRERGRRRDEWTRRVMSKA